MPDEEGLSLEELSTAYAELLQRGTTPYDEPHLEAEPVAEVASEVGGVEGEARAADLCCDLTPKSILEAMLFVGNVKNRPLTSKQVAGLMRGVRPQEIDDLVQELNGEYAAEGRPYVIVSLEAGYAMQLRPECSSLQGLFYGRVKEASLTQPAIDVLAIVAYRQPISRHEVDQIRGKPSGGMLAQLLRRGLLRLDRSDNRERPMHYQTTDRFLELFGLESLMELPQSQEVPAESDEKSAG